MGWMNFVENYQKPGAKMIGLTLFFLCQVCYSYEELSSGSGLKSPRGNLRLHHCMEMGREAQGCFLRLGCWWCLCFGLRWRNTGRKRGWKKKLNALNKFGILNIKNKKMFYIYFQVENLWFDISISETLGSSLNQFSNSEGKSWQ